MADVMHGIEEDVPFDNGTADLLIAGCTSAATAIEGQSTSRAAWTTTALADFKGQFSTLFSANATVASTDATELADRLREVALGAGKLKEEARKEQERRETARQWKQEQDDRNLWDKGVDTLFGGDDPPVGPAADEPTIPVSASRNGTRQTPTPGGSAGGSGTSSARPADLRTFATNSGGANDDLRWRPGSLRSRMGDFTARCRWGRLDASGVFGGFDAWLEANDQDVQWATLVADAFAAAGGEGNVSTVADSALLATLQAAGVDASRTDIVIDPPTAYGSPPTTGYANDPVNTATGNFIEVELDLGFAGAAGTLTLGRTYNSFASLPSTTAATTGTSRPTAFGAGWSSWAEAGLSFDDDSARLVLPDGRTVVFPRLGSAWDRATGENLWLEALDTGHRASDSAGTSWRFSAEGHLLGTSAGPGTGVEATHEQGRLVRLTHERGRSVDLVWDDVLGRVTQAVADDGRQVTYAYDDRARLVAVTGPGGTRAYTWNDAGLIDSVTDADGVIEAVNTYDDRGRVTTQRSAHGRLTRFVYLPGQVTVVSDADGSRSNTWIHDRRGRLVGVVDAHERRQSSSYDNHGNLVMASGRDGSVTVHGYDQRGRRIRTVTPAGADITYGYDDQDRVVTVVTESGATTEYSYDGADRNPSLMIDPEGGRTRFTWDDGLLIEVVDPVGVTVRFSHDSHGDLVATTNAMGDVARLERDTTGRVRTAITPSGARTTYAYAPGGMIASRRDPDGATWRYEHSAAGRLTAVTDPTGARTEIEHGAHGDETRTIDPLGRALTRHLDDLGNLAGVELPDGAQWQFSHDALSRLVATTDPTGAHWRNEYDETGGLVATVDPTGVRRSITSDAARGRVQLDDGLQTTIARFDPLGRPIATEQVDGSAALTTYDRCGRPVEQVDGDGGLVLIRRDAAGRAVETVRPSGATTRYEYDVCGRLQTVIDPAGARTSREYDVDGRLTRQVMPTGEAAWVGYDVCGRVTELSRPGHGVARYRYDAAGRVVESSDTWWGRRRFRYDAAGQLVETVNGLGGVTRWEYDANGRAVTVTDPLGAVERREFDAMGRAVSRTDALGRTTRAGYDGAGRQVWQVDPTGTRTTWAFDATGRLASTAVDDRVVSSITRDLRERRLVVHDLTSPDGPGSVHELEWDRRGHLVRRTRDGRSVTWEHDADGHRTTMTTPDGHRTTWERDVAGHLSSVSHPLLGRAVLERDAAGRLVGASAGGLILTWEHQNGYVASHTVGDTDGFHRTSVRRDLDGRITAVERDGVTTAYSYDEACQLIEARAGESVGRWHHDPAGRLVSESADGVTRTFAHDAASQLTSVQEEDGRRTTHSYDGLGRRVRSEHADGSVRELSWSPTGWLSGITDRLGAEVRHTALQVDVLGELARVDGSEMFWDTAAPYAGAPVLAGETPVLAAGPLTGIGSAWSAPGWRSARSTGIDPWASGAESNLAAALPARVAVGPAAEVAVAGLEWLGARVYDPASRGFLSVDPLEPVTGAGWSGNPYSYAGNDPLHAVDPTGLRPVTDAELAAYSAANNGAMGAVGDWVGDNWEYLAGGAMVLAGGVLIATGVGGPAGMMLVSAGADTIIQKATTGEVNWGQVALTGALGGFGGAGIAARAGLTGTRAAVVAGMSSGGISGGLTGGYQYMSGPGPHTPGGFIQATAVSTAAGTLMGGAGGGAGHAVAGRLMDSLTTNPAAHTMTMGRDMTHRVIPYADAHDFGYYNGTPSGLYNAMDQHLPGNVSEGVNTWINKKWINFQMMEGRNLVDVGQPAGMPPSPYYDMELQQVAGYPGYSQDIQP